MTDIPDNITLEFLARQQERLLKELREGFHDMRLEMNVQNAIIMRLDTTCKHIVTELQAISEAFFNQSQRLRKLEEEPRT